jgi:hypothetical protein
MDHTQALRPSPAVATPPGTLRWQVFCPICAAEEIDRVPADGGDHAAVVVQPDRDEYGGPLGTRGGHLEIRLECGSGHGFALVIANHKGAEFVGLVPVGLDTGHRF